MKQNYITHKEHLFFIECAFVFVFLLLPPLFSTVPFTLPPKPKGLYAQCTFYFSTIYAAMYEEILYRLYTPNRMKHIYTVYIQPWLKRKHLVPESTAQLLLPFFLQLPCRNITTEILEETLFTEFFALLLFTLAHRYLGTASMLFAAGAGMLFRIAYLKLKHILHPAISIATIAAVHSLWNIGVYYYLWKNTEMVHH